jgi:hypothetical protein
VPLLPSILDTLLGYDINTYPNKYVSRTNSTSSDSDWSSSADGGSSVHLDELVVGLDERHPLSVILTVKSIAISLIIVVIVGFTVGTVARNHLLGSFATTKLASAYPYMACSVDKMNMEHTSTGSIVK